MSKLSIFVGSVYGNAQSVAEHVEGTLSAAGTECEVLMDPSVADFEQAESVLVVTSTTGQGDVPPNLEFFFDELKDSFPLMQGKPFAVAGLGDSSYGESYCAAGRKFFELLTELQGNPVADMLEVDAIESLEPEADVTKWLEEIKGRLLA